MVVDLEERSRYLQRALLAAFPAYRQHKGAEPLYDQLQKKAERLAHPNTASR
jgi:hypothetical protein